MPTIIPNTIKTTRLSNEILGRFCSSGIKKVNINQKIENPKRNLPELRIAKLKNRLTSEIEKESNNDESNNNIKTNNQINNQKKPKK